MNRFKRMVIMLATLGVGGFAVSTASGDIFAWTDENGIRHFTNYAPPKQATLFMKTPEIPHDEEADNQRREMDRITVAEQELAEREALLLEAQQAAERRIAAANARVEAALQEADQLLQKAQAAAEDTDSNRSSSYGYGYYYPFYGYGFPYHYKGNKRYDGGLYRKKHPPKHQIDHHTHKWHHPKGTPSAPHTAKHPLHNRNRYEQKYRAISPSAIVNGRYPTHQSRTAAFRGRHGF
jgi:hypothetical protein